MKHGSSCFRVSKFSGSQKRQTVCVERSTRQLFLSGRSGRTQILSIIQVPAAFVKVRSSADVIVPCGVGSKNKGSGARVCEGTACQSAISQTKGQEESPKFFPQLTRAGQGVADHLSQHRQTRTRPCQTTAAHHSVRVRSRSGSERQLSWVRQFPPSSKPCQGGFCA